MHQHLSYRDPRGRRRKKKKRNALKKFLKKLQLKTFPTIVNQFQEMQSPLQDKPKEKHETDVNQANRKKANKPREKQQVTYKGKSIQLTEDLSAETLQVRKEWQDIFKMLKEKKKKIYNQDQYTQQRSHSKLMEKSKTSQTSKS